MNSKEYLYLFKRVPQIKRGKYEDLINLGDEYVGDLYINLNTFIYV